MRRIIIMRSPGAIGLSAIGVAVRAGVRPTMARTRQRFSLLIGLVSISDRASSGVYTDKGIPGLTEWFTAALRSPWRMESRLIPDEQPQIERTLARAAGSVSSCSRVQSSAACEMPSPIAASPAGDIVYLGAANGTCGRVR